MHSTKKHTLIPDLETYDMAQADPGPLLDEHLDELELIVKASENDGCFSDEDKQKLTSDDACFLELFEPLDYVLGWHDRHDRQLLEAARWALANGWQRSTRSDVNPS